MNRIEISLLFIILFLSPIISLAEHDCDDGRVIGHQLNVKMSLPINWLSIGDRQLNDNQFHTDLRKKYAQHYISGQDSEGFTIDHFCGFKDGVYVYIANGDFGPFAEFSKKAPKCYPCKPVKETMPFLISGTKLKIGQDKKTVSSILGYKIEHDITSISFEEIEKDKNHITWHSQTLRVEFRNDKLFRFSVDDYRERSN